MGARDGEDVRRVQPWLPRPGGPRLRGFALALSLLVVALLGLLTYISVSLSTLESRTAWRQYQGARALYAARAGLSRALAELAQDPGWPGTSRQDLEEDTWYSVQVTSSPLNATASLRRWRV
ncbi:MAG TPA: hypothetical protein VNO81_12420, partial [Candidatus Nitrosotenuis sp.]|nr:hypothetical protein [Candidatus Nitrosotenuis sp.]